VGTTGGSGAVTGDGFGAIGRMEMGVPKVGLVCPAGAGVAERGFDLRADVGCGERFGVGLVKNGGNRLDELAVKRGVAIALRADGRDEERLGSIGRATRT